MDGTEILVIGDWVIDENWVLATHRSPMSTVEGRSHLRALGGLSSKVMTFCGAGRVARILYWRNRFNFDVTSSPSVEGTEHKRQFISVSERTGVWFKIFALGNWAEGDETKLFALFHPRVSEISCVGHSMRRAYAPQTEVADP